MLARTEDIYGMAERMFDGAKRNCEAAVEAIIEQLKTRPGYQDTAFKIAAETLVGQLYRQDRAAIRGGKDVGSITIDDAPSITPAIGDLKHAKQSPASISASNDRLKGFSVELSGLYLTPYRHRGHEFLLGLATPEELKPVAAHYYAQGATMVRESAFLEKVIAISKNGTPIHKSLTLLQLERLRKEADELPV